MIQFHGIDMSESSNFQNPELKNLAAYPLNFNSFKNKWSNVFKLAEINQKSYYNLPNSVFFIEIRPQNPEFRILFDFRFFTSHQQSLCYIGRVEPVLS